MPGVKAPPRGLRLLESEGHMGPLRAELGSAHQPAPWMESFSWRLSELNALCAERRPSGLEITSGFQKHFMEIFRSLKDRTVPRKTFGIFREENTDYLSYFRLKNNNFFNKAIDKSERKRWKKRLQLTSLKLRTFIHPKKKKNGTERKISWGLGEITHLTVKELASSIYKELLQINKTSKLLFFKWAEDMNRHFRDKYKKDHKDVKSCSASLVIREMQVKTKLRYDSMAIRLAEIWKTISSISKDVEQWEFSYTVHGDVNWFSHWEQLGFMLQN